MLRRLFFRETPESFFAFGWGRRRRERAGRAGQRKSSPDCYFPPKEGACFMKKSKYARTAGSSVHFAVDTGSASRLYMRAPRIDSRKGEWVAMMN